MLADLLTRPAHSIINQSYDSKLRVDLLRPLNGDGFGVGWYPLREHDDSKLPTDSGGESSRLDNTELVNNAEGNADENDSTNNIVQQEFSLINAYTDPDGPCIFSSTLPAWNNINLIRIAEKIKAKLVFAHVRAASPGFPISETNCHPWSFGKWMFMHNGFISHFRKIKRRLQLLLKEDLFHFVQGSTDSEWSFALFLNQLGDPIHGQYSPEDIRITLLKTIAVINSLCREAGITQPSLLNFAVSNGETIVCSRYVNSLCAEPASLFFSSGSRFEASQPGIYKMIKSDRREDVIIVSSEPLTHERDDWISVPRNTVIVITPKLNMLLYPINDEFYRPHSSVPFSAAAKVECQ